MHLTRAERRSNKYLRDHCKIIKFEHERDPYGHLVPAPYEETIYDGKCFVSPGNMWPFETGQDVMRGSRTDVQVYIPRAVDGLTSECVIDYDNNRYEVIAYAPRYTAGASLNITARRVS
jgi:hypothetical protein